MRVVLVSILLATLILSGCDVIENIWPDTADSIQEKNPMEDFDTAPDDTGIQRDQAPIPETGCGNQICDGEETKCTCPDDCGICKGSVSLSTHWECVQDQCEIVTTKDVCGNKICEAGEFDFCSEDCPLCSDNDRCTKDSFNYDTQSCIHETKPTCCGNDKCEAGESESCLEDCQADLSLRNYPEPFVKDNTFQAQLIVGTKGKNQAELILAGISIMEGFNFAEVGSGYSTEAKLDDEISSIKNKNVILLGSPCQNKFTAELMPYDNKCDEEMPGTGSLVRLFKTGTDTYAIAVMGKTGQAIRRAGEFLATTPSMHGYEVRP